MPGWSQADREALGNLSVPFRDQVRYGRQNGEDFDRAPALKAGAIWAYRNASSSSRLVKDDESCPISLSRACVRSIGLSASKAAVDGVSQT